ncbi:hypothetical protein KSS87_009136, partial [Heliosperma pusillum]
NFFTFGFDSTNFTLPLLEIYFRFGCIGNIIALQLRIIIVLHIVTLGYVCLQTLSS